MCPFNAILFHEDRMVTEINPALCQGCGTCVAACPSNAITGTQFSNEQVLAQLEGMLMVSFNGNGGTVRVLEPEVA
jgi:heterodisulfide reductase subunit A